MKTYSKVINIIVAVCGGFMFINYFSYLLKLFVFSEGTLPYIAAFTVVICLPLLAVLHFKGVLSRLFGRIYIVLRSVFAFGLAFYTATFILLCAFILGAEHSAPPPTELPDNTYVLTLGAKVEQNGEPGKILRRRLDTTYDILTENKTLRCIVSGGQGSDEPISEAECMKNYLVEKGIASDRIILEDKATNTIENIENTLSILNGLDSYGGIAVVTTNFHLPRAKFLANRLGADMERAYFYGAPNSEKAMLYTILVREYMSYCKLFIFGT